MKAFACATAMAVAAFSPACATVFDAASYTPGVTFANGLSSVTMTIAFDGTNYWSATGGSASGTRLAKYDSAGNVLGTYAPGLDFRSVFTDVSGTVYAREWSSETIYQQTSDGVFTPYLTLSGGSLDSQSSVVFNSAGEFVAMDGGLVERWSATGAYLGSFSLSGYSGSYPYDRGIAAMDDYLLTYDSPTATVLAWDYSGTLLDSAVLTGGGSGHNPSFSFSYANDMVFVTNTAYSQWQGYDVGIGDVVMPDVPLPFPAALLMGGLGGLALLRRRAA